MLGSARIEDVGRIQNGTMKREERMHSAGNKIGC